MLLTRAAMETTAALWTLHGKLAKALERFSIKLRRLVIASEAKQSRLPPLPTITGLLRPPGLFDPGVASRNDDLAWSKTALKLGRVDVSALGTYPARLRVGQGKSIAEEDDPKAVHILDFIRAVDKDCKGFERQYDRLSEFAHPPGGPVLRIVAFTAFFFTAFPSIAAEETRIVGGV